MYHKLRWLAPIIFTAIILTLAMGVSAQDATTEEDEFLFEITGALEFSDTGDIIVNEIVIAPSGAFNPSDYNEGDLVIVIGYLLNDTTLQAVSIQLAPECDADSDTDDADENAENCVEVEDDDDTSGDCETDPEAEGCEDTECPTDEGDGTTEGETGDTTDEADPCDDATDCDTDDGDTEGETEDADPCEDPCAVEDEEPVSDAGIIVPGEEGEDDCINSEGPHPVLTALATEFELDYDTLQDWRDQGFGIGEIARALLLAEQLDDGETDADAILAMRSEMGWGQIMQEYDVHPSDLAPGRVISRRHHDDDDETTLAIRRGNNGNNGNGNGRGNNGNGGGNGNGGNGNGGNGRGGGRGNG
jgi:hypothetical protein